MDIIYVNEMTMLTGLDRTIRYQYLVLLHSLSEYEL